MYRTSVGVTYRVEMENIRNEDSQTTKKDGHTRERKKRRNQQQKGTLIEAITVDGSPVYTWVPKVNLPIDIVHALKDGVASFLVSRDP